MAQNLRSKIAAMGIKVQTTPGVFDIPNETTDLIPVASLTNAGASITAQDPTLTGAIWDSNPIVLGESYTIGGSIPLRGPGGASPPALDGWVPGRVLKAAGFSEGRLAAAVSSTLQAGSTTSALVLATSESSVDDFLTGTVIQTANLGTGFRQTGMIQGYAGSLRTAYLAETMSAAPAAGVAYTRPAQLTYLLGTLTTAPPLLSISIFRDLKRFDFRDCALTSLSIDAPVANEANQVFPTMDFQFKGNFVGEYDDTTPTVLPSVINVPIPPVRGGKFILNKTMLGHQDAKITLALTTGAASNQNQDAGQDGYDIQSGTRTVDLDINETSLTTIDLTAISRQQLPVFIESTWGLGAGNRFGLIVRNMLLQPLALGDRNGYVNRTGQASPSDPDKAIALSIWWA